MNTYLSLSESGEYRFFKIQHRWRGSSNRPDQDWWSGGTAIAWGTKSLRVARRFSEYPSDEFATREEAEEFLKAWAPAVVSHQSVDFRIVEVVAKIVVTPTFDLEGPRVCGAWSNFGYCQKAPEHSGAHDSDAWNQKDRIDVEEPAAAAADGT